ncbi:hypothetical protein K470DRAFT_249211 [Piedraia hortae CBS 480.64]|uniref:Uncharacterized protein n=1 Tax=Piedraia hortae CBS 480.64 TaxID=1314780 RepID=A0A6A7BXQ0_9PEZI|nr:hypothetical protein K470DRAFT_249211 [Piedraia hortae CBS 480.64]
MCFKTACPTCNKATWNGCGKHVQSVMDSIPQESRCACEPLVEIDGKKYPYVCPFIHSHSRMYTARPPACLPNLTIHFSLALPSEYADTV